MVINFLKKYWLEILGIGLTAATYVVEAKMADKNSALYEAQKEDLKEQIKGEIYQELGLVEGGE